MGYKYHVEGNDDGTANLFLWGLPDDDALYLIREVAERLRNLRRFRWQPASGMDAAEGRQDAKQPDPTDDSPTSPSGEGTP